MYLHVTVGSQGERHQRKAYCELLIRPVHNTNFELCVYICNLSACNILKHTQSLIRIHTCTDQFPVSALWLNGDCVVSLAHKQSAGSSDGGLLTHYQHRVPGSPACTHQSEQGLHPILTVEQLSSNSSQALVKYILNLSHFRLTNCENNVKKARSQLRWPQREKEKAEKI